MKFSIATSKKIFALFRNDVMIRNRRRCSEIRVLLILRALWMHICVWRKRVEYGFVWILNLEAMVQLMDHSVSITFSFLTHKIPYFDSYSKTNERNRDTTNSVETLH